MTEIELGPAGIIRWRCINGKWSKWHYVEGEEELKALRRLRFAYIK